MHAFVDEMEFTNMKFVDALRHFLQAFRLPGEAQKIDRFMLKFAERYLKGNPTQFSNADTAYVLAYSVIMLNTDLHNPQIKKHMTKEEFVKNNRGIDDGKDLSREFLEGIYDHILTNEIRMKEEMERSGKGAGDTDGKDDDSFSRNGRSLASETIAMKTEAVFAKMLKARKRVGTQNQMLSSEIGASAGVSSTWFSATHYEHVRSMFDLVWTPLLAGVSGPLQDTEDVETINLSLEGLKYAIRIACLFNMDLERRAFMSTLSRLTMLPTVKEMRPKNLEAIRQLLEVAWLEGNNLVESWKDVCMCISQLEKLSLLGGGGPEEALRKQTPGERSKNGKQTFADEVASDSTSQLLVVAVDRIFTSSVKLSGPAITEFATALCQVSWDEIQSSAQWEHPRMFSLQKLVEISYYNMGRIRVEWSNLWHILGEHFNKVGGHPNRNVALFAVDRLRQLALKFLEIEELPHFKFQKDFLRPFEIILQESTDINIKDLVLRSLTQMIQMKSKNLRSGWKAMLLVFTKAAREQTESIVTLAFETVKNMQKAYLETIVASSAFPDLVNCMVEFCKNKFYPKTSLQAIELLRGTIHKMVEVSKSPAYSKSQSVGSVLELSTPTNITLSKDPISEKPTATVLNPLSDDPMLKFWFPMLFGLYEVIMTCELEVRTRGLTYLFDALKSYGASFTRDFWDVVCRGVLLPIFDDLRLSRSEKTKFANKEDMSVWLSTTLIKALREFIDLFSFYFELLNFLIDGVLDLLGVCITQENETLARIGSTCLQQFIESNVYKMDDAAWVKVCNCFVKLFEATTPYGLFEYPGGRPAIASNVETDRSDEQLPQELQESGTRRSGEHKKHEQSLSEGEAEFDDASPSKRSPELKIQTDFERLEVQQGPALSVVQAPQSPKDKKKDFQQTVMKCVLQLLLIQTLHETINQNDNIYRSLKAQHMFVLLDCLDRSYRFAQKFNNDTDLRMALYRGGEDSKDDLRISYIQ
ncbi:guanine nucleotide exchange protein for ADP-robosylation factor [Gonapodya sp. JEL0774]|nr:guanine nucleotide exchange protein for ADP-robosylation factor [Gonapodya sp. JEL0774]